MRSFALIILFLGILTTDIGLASPVSYLLSTLKGRGSAEKTDNDNEVAKRDVTNSATDAVTDSEEANTSFKWNLCRGHGTTCRSLNQSDEVDLISDHDKGSNDIGSSLSSNALPARQLVDPSSAVLNTPCAKAIIAKYDQIDFNTLSVEDEKALLKSIIDCVYGPSKNTSNLSARDSTDATIATTEAGKRCSTEQWQNAYLATHWDALNEQNKIIWWIILTNCLRQEPNSPIKRRERRFQWAEPAQLHCIEGVLEEWEEHRTNGDEEAAFMLAMSACANPSPSEKSLAPSDVHEYDLVKDQECMEKVTESWTGDLSTKEDIDAFMLAVMRCINEPQTPILPTTSPLATRDECRISKAEYAAWANRLLSVYVYSKGMDHSRWHPEPIIDGLTPCLSGAVDWFYRNCASDARQGMLDARINHCWFETFYYGGPGCSKDNPCKKCGRDQPAHICP